MPKYPIKLLSCTKNDLLAVIIIISKSEPIVFVPVATEPTTRMHSISDVC